MGDLPQFRDAPQAADLPVGMVHLAKAVGDAVQRGGHDGQQVGGRMLIQRGKQIAHLPELPQLIGAVIGKIPLRVAPQVGVGDAGHVAAVIEIQGQVDLADVALGPAAEKRLPEGITLTGGGAKLKDIDYFAKHALGASVRLGAPHGLGGVADAVQKPEFAVAVGLMLLAAESEESAIASAKKAGSGQKLSWIKKLFSKV